ncbi:hypothetical protein OROHE_010150 [Orobanche hederae]
MPHGCFRVSVDGLLPGINQDVLLPVPVPGEMEAVTEAVGSHVAWPRSLISFPDAVQQKELPPKKNELKEFRTKFSEAAPPQNVPKRWNLYTELCEAKELDTFGFFDPGLTYNLNEDFKSNVVKRLRESRDRIYFIPHNMNQHFILGIIWDESLDRGSQEFNSQTGRSNTIPKVKNLAGTPK